MPAPRPPLEPVGSQAPKYKSITGETDTPKNREKAPKANKVAYEIRVA